MVARPGDDLATALWRHGVRSIGCTRKRHLPLGWSGTTIAGVLAQVDGRPNVRLDCELAHAGQIVRSQNAWPSPRFDLLKAARLVPARWVYGGFEHSNLIKSGTPGFEIWDRLLAFLAGVADPPATTRQRVDPGAREIEVDTLVVGGGPHGRDAARRAAAQGHTVALFTRGREVRQVAGDAAMPPAVAIHDRHEVFGVYRSGEILLAAPHDHRAPAVIIRPRHIVLATGRRSVPPLVPGNHLPGVLDARTAFSLAGSDAPLGRTLVVGTGAEAAVAEALANLGVVIVAALPVSMLAAIVGRRRVRGVCTDRSIACDTVVHAGPWVCEDMLSFQLRAEGLLQLGEAPPTAGGVTWERTGQAAEGSDRIPVRSLGIDDAYVCPCMDVTVGEIRAAIAEGHHDPEVLKRLTSCGMGPCQGFPCWHLMIAVLADPLGMPEQAFQQPTRRSPARSITVAQAAALQGLVQPL